MSNDLFEKYRQQFKGNAVPAAGLFFHDQYDYKALRVEAPTIGKEFTDGVWIGSDPDGTLFYYSTGDMEKATSYVIEQVTNPSDGKQCAQVTFTFTDDPDADPFAVFLAYDPANVIGLTRMNGYSNEGKWTDLHIGQVSGLVEKTSTGTHITITTDIIGKKAVISNVASAFTDDKNVNSRGTFSFKSIADISTATAANYNKDRIVFYKDPAHAKDFIAYFIPFEGSTAGQIEANSLGNADTEFRDIVWSDI
ncbi:hypothetical protein BKA70DRAFT_1237025 [Coprinopsis sp. MPI-PUGE-AT-0042]|nr:hypothetical protein BKA70DRAFT_1237025 [Coprinopsis sp. MPI-PUGE-AT-0042]